MIKYIFCAFLPAVITVQSCGSQSNNTESKSPVKVEQGEIPETPKIEEDTSTKNSDVQDQTAPANEPRQAAQSKKEIEKITVSFISIGEGIDYEAMKNYKDFLENWKSSSGKELSYETIGWGREGETDFCVDMTNISDNESKRFLSETRDRVKDNSLVQIETNQQCKESRIRK